VAEITADVFLSADGYAGGQEVGPYFDYGGPELDRWIATELARPQVILLGRRTYEIFAQMSAEATDEISQRMAAHPKVVVSRTLAEPLAWSNARVIRDVPDELAAFKRASQHPIRTMGSLSLVRCLLALGLLDRLRLMVFPLALGEAGREYFWSGIACGALGSVTAEVLDARVTLLTYTLPVADRTG
jgi:dihydrofolate reductase